MKEGDKRKLNTKNKGTFSSSNQPKNRSVRTAGVRMNILAAMKREGVTEDGFYDLLVRKAMREDDPFTFKELLSRLSPVPKAVSPLVEFPFPEDASLTVQAVAVLDAIARGIIPADIGNIFVTTIKSVIDIEEFIELKQRIESIEASLGVQNV